MRTTIKISAFAFVLALMSFTTTSKNNDSAKSPVSWKNETIELGEIPQGIPKAIDFEFKNTGDKAIEITNVKASCGCTTTNYTKTPIQPGETAKISASYNATAKGAFTKNVTVTTNAEETPKVLSFKGIVI